MSDIGAMGPEEAMQETLAELVIFDARAGTRLVDVFNLSVANNPDLASVYVFPFEDDELEERGLDYVPSLISTTDGDMAVTLSTELSHLGILMDVVLGGRLTEHREHVKHSQGYVGLPDMANIAVAHELGHADMDKREIDQYGLDEANRRRSAAYLEGMRSLPLWTETTQAVDYWEQNTGGYRTYLERCGVDEAAFEQRLRQNLAAYNELPMEVAADQFALGIVKQMYV